MQYLAENVASSCFNHCNSFSHYCPSLSEELLRETTRRTNGDLQPADFVLQRCFLTLVLVFLVKRCPPVPTSPTNLGRGARTPPPPPPRFRRLHFSFQLPPYINSERNFADVSASSSERKYYIIHAYCTRLPLVSSPDPTPPAESGHETRLPLGSR